MSARGFTLIELVIVALVLGVIALIAIPNFTGSLSNLMGSKAHDANVTVFPPNFTASKRKGYVASVKADLVRLALAEEQYFRDSLTYSTTVVCTTPPAPGVVNFCPSRLNVLRKPTVTVDFGPAWAATMTNINMPDVTCSIFVGSTGAWYPALVEGTPACRRPGWSGHASDTTGQVE